MINPGIDDDAEVYGCFLSGLFGGDLKKMCDDGAAFNGRLLSLNGNANCIGFGDLMKTFGAGILETILFEPEPRSCNIMPGLLLKGGVLGGNDLKTKGRAGGGSPNACDTNHSSERESKLIYMRKEKV